MSNQDNGQVSTLQRPTTNDPEAWKAYWKAQGWLWRTEPEIDEQRQKYLAERRAVVPDIEQGIYPFKDIKLSRADVEWLLSTHENGCGPVDWNDKSQRERQGLDLCGADLSQLNLSYLPLTRLHAGLWTSQEHRPVDKNHVWRGRSAAVLLEKANLFRVHLEGSILTWANLENASLELAHVELADLEDAHLEGASLRRAHLEGANLRFVFFNMASNLNYASLSNKDLGCVSVGDTNWNNINLAMINWSQIDMLGDERRARQTSLNGKKTDITQLDLYRVAVRANRQLAVALQAQGLSEETAKFAYRAQKLQRVVLWRQKKFGQYLFSGFLDLLAGYGYQPGRSVLWYLAVIFGFTLAYHFLGGLSLYPPDAFVFSIMSFHGRGFFPSLNGETNLHNPLVMLAAAEAIIGLLIEISFIATFTQRFFGR